MVYDTQIKWLFSKETLKVNLVKDGESIWYSLPMFVIDFKVRQIKWTIFKWTGNLQKTNTWCPWQQLAALSWYLGKTACGHNVLTDPINVFTRQMNGETCCQAHEFLLFRYSPYQCALQKWLLLNYLNV